MRSERSTLAIAIESVINRDPILGTQLTYALDVFQQLVLAENSGNYSEAQATLDALVLRLKSHRDSLDTAKRAAKQ